MANGNGNINGPVQVFAEGLLGFFQLKNNGRNPYILDNSIYSMLEVRDWLFATRSVISDVSSVGLTTGQLGFRVYTTNPIVVPSGEVWYVTDYTVFANLDGGAGEEIFYAPAFASQFTGPSVKGIHTLAVREGLSGIAAGSRVVASSAAKPFFLPQGHRLGLYVSGNITAATIEIEATYRYVRLPI